MEKVVIWLLDSFIKSYPVIASLKPIFEYYFGDGSKVDHDTCQNAARSKTQIILWHVLLLHFSSGCRKETLFLYMSSFLNP